MSMVGIPAGGFFVVVVVVLFLAVSLHYIAVAAVSLTACRFRFTPSVLGALLVIVVSRGVFGSAGGGDGGGSVWGRRAL